MPVGEMADELEVMSFGVAPQRTHRRVSERNGYFSVYHRQSHFEDDNSVWGNKEKYNYERGRRPSEFY